MIKKIAYFILFIFAMGCKSNTSEIPAPKLSEIVLGTYNCKFELKDISLTGNATVTIKVLTENTVSVTFLLARSQSNGIISNVNLSTIDANTIGIKYIDNLTKLNGQVQNGKNLSLILETDGLIISLSGSK